MASVVKLTNCAPIEKLKLDLYLFEHQHKTTQQKILFFPDNENSLIKTLPKQQLFFLQKSTDIFHSIIFILLGNFS